MGVCWFCWCCVVDDGGATTAYCDVVPMVVVDISKVEVVVIDTIIHAAFLAVHDKNSSQRQWIG